MMNVLDVLASADFRLALWVSFHSVLISKDVRNHSKNRHMSIVGGDSGGHLETSALWLCKYDDPKCKKALINIVFGL